MPIHPGSTSYPFLALARRHDADYGLVLTYADMVQRAIDANFYDFDPPRTAWETLALRDLSAVLKDSTAILMHKEHNRRRAS